jgi:hypothetical protein
MHVVRDVRDVEYRESIKEYMKRIRTTDFCLVLISEQFLKSRNCMYEMLEFIKDEQYVKKVLPVILNNTRITDSAARAIYVEYWQNEYRALDQKRQNLEPTNQRDILQELVVIESIQRTLPVFLTTISEMKYLVVDGDITLNICNEIAGAIDPSLNPKNPLSQVQGFFVLNVPQSMIHDLFLWWKSNSKGYTMDIREAKIFSLDEVQEMFGNAEYGEWDSKKFAGISIQKVLDLETNKIAFLPQFTNMITKDKEKIFGNKRLWLRREEIDEYH